MNYDFKVKLTDVVTEGKVIPKKAAVYNADTNEPIGIVSNRYGLVKHEEVINSLREALQGHEIKETISLNKNGAQMIATYQLPKVQYPVAQGDFVSLQFIAKNSYDGSNSFQIMLGAMRLVCTNGMVIGKEFFTFRQKHFSRENTVRELFKVVAELNRTFEDSIPVMTKMTKTEMTLLHNGQFDPKKLQLPKYLVEEARNQYEKQEKQTVWDYYNCFTSAITHAMKKESPQAQIDYLKRAWQVCVAEL